ncbi:MAG TPA: ABC transporter permease [Candidatus Acidoferrales bacterium]|nr:ABC transporter permease [Candidatus Acidoferrales bacterium]
MTTSVWAFLPRKAFAFVRRDFLTDASYRLAWLLQSAEILLIAAIAYFLGRFLRQQGLEAVTSFAHDYFSFVILGIAFFDYLGTALNSFAHAIREGQVTGTLETLLVTQTRLESIVLGSSLYPFLSSTARVTSYLVVGALFFGLPLGNADWGAALLLLALSIVAFSSFGIVSASFTLLFKRGDPFTWLLLGASGLLGGVFYPVAVLPPWLKAVAQFLPITYCLEGMRRALLAGDGVAELRRETLVLLLFAGVGLPLALALFRWSVHRAKLTGALAQY